MDLTSAAFTGADSLPRFLLGDSLLSASRLESLSVRVALPETTGTVTLRVVFHNGRAQPAVTVTVGGRLARWFEGAHLSGIPVRVPGTTRLLGNGEHGLVWFDVLTGAASPALPDSAHEPICGYSPGLSLVPGVVIGSRHPNPPPTYDACRTYAWQVAPTLAVVDSVPTYGAWALTYTGPGRWIVGQKHYTYACDSLACTNLGHLEQPEEFVVSPDGSRLFPELASVASDDAGTPVYDATHGTIAYRLSRLATLNGVGFSENGDTAFVIGIGPASTYDTLYAFAIDPLTGAVFREGRLPYGYPELIAVDQNRPWLYMVDDDGSGIRAAPVLRVIDRRTLRQVAVLRGPAGTPGINTANTMFPVISLGERRLYVVGTPNWSGPATSPSDVFVFELLP